MDRRKLLAGGMGMVLKPVRAAGVLRLVVAYPPGGVSDRVARLLAQRLGPELGLNAIVENRPGAGGSVALQWLAQALPDGRTLAFCAISPLALSPHLGTPAPQVQPVTGIMHTPLLLVATPALPVRDFAGLLRHARTPGAVLRWATSGVGTIGHLALEQVRRDFDLDIVHVPYSGGAPQLQDALAGHFELLSTNLAPQQVEYVQEGRLTALALGAPARLPLLPQVPTFAEAGSRAANLSSLFGLFAPPATPEAEVLRINAACTRVLAEPEFRRILTAAGNLPAEGSPAAFAAEIARQSAHNGRLLSATQRR